MRYFLPDDRWDFFGIDSKDDYVQKNVIEGNFHDDVPEDIIKSFETVTQLTAQAYYYYPIYDEALNKALRVVELAVKIKAVELKLGEGNLFKTINKICKRPNFEHLKDVFHRAREIRNIHMHPTRHSAGWFMAKGKGNIQMFGNCINEIFLRDKELEKRHSERKKIEFLLQSLKGPIAVEVKDNVFFVEAVSSFRIFSRTGKVKVVFCLTPYYDDIADRINEMNCTPYYIILDKFRSNENEINGKTVDGVPITIKSTENIIALEHQKKWSESIDIVPKEKQELYFLSVRDRFIWQCEDLIYNHCWKN
ncbi:hypothetical protein HC174_08670 [Salinimicrobium sp. CDJ15-81-2]|nr:hypothetical protein [Salinimicrobium nanhaiense]